MTRGRKWLASTAIAVVALGAGTGIAVASGGDDDATDAPITGTAELDRATAAALDATGGGEVVATEIDDEEGYYEVEIKLDDGSNVDVHLDKSFNVLDSQADGDSREDEGQN